MRLTLTVKIGDREEKKYGIEIDEKYRAGKEPKDITGIGSLRDGSTILWTDQKRSAVIKLKLDASVTRKIKVADQSLPSHKNCPKSNPTSLKHRTCYVT